MLIFFISHCLHVWECMFEIKIEFNILLVKCMVGSRMKVNIINPAIRKRETWYNSVRCVVWTLADVCAHQPIWSPGDLTCCFLSCVSWGSCFICKLGYTHLWSPYAPPYSLVLMYMFCVAFLFQPEAYYGIMMLWAEIYVWKPKTLCYYLFSVLDSGLQVFFLLLLFLFCFVLMLPFWPPSSILPSSHFKPMYLCFGQQHVVSSHTMLNTRFPLRSLGFPWDGHREAGDRCAVGFLQRCGFYLTHLWGF